MYSTSLCCVFYLRVKSWERVALAELHLQITLFAINLHSIPYTLTLSSFFPLFGVAGSRGYLKPRFASFQYTTLHYGTVLHCTLLHCTVQLHCTTALSGTLLLCTFLPLYNLPQSPQCPHTTTAGTIQLQRTSVRFCRTVLYRCRTVTLASSLTPTLGRWLISIPSHTRLDQALPAPRFLPTKPVTLHIVYTSPRSS